MKVVKIVFVLLIVAVLAGAGFSYWIFSAVKAPQEHSKADQFIVIEKGSTPKQIIAKLSGEGVIANYTATLIYLRLFGDTSNLQAGEYQFPSPITPLQVFKELEKGETQTTKLTIPEGFTRFDIAKRIAEKFPNAFLNVETIGETVEGRRTRVVLEMMNDTSLIKDIAPQATSLEGYIYPSTYSLSRDADLAQIIKVMVEQFKKTWKPEWTALAQSAGHTPHEIVTIASLIETETGVESERPIVAGVINNRLSKNMPLGIDQTNVYIAKMMGRWDGTIHRSDLDVDSPYNTRIKVGLPPGPISSVSESSIRAALFPDRNDYIFYVRDVDRNDGSHWFYASAAEFEKGKARYQQWLEKERQEKRAEQNNQ
ncbi:MAG: endolytic transglycosylase MltG [Chloracidobacterium sp.]|nr:endolytic transglycosylase MltG [Chloracidobacterium sp.]